MNKKILLVFIFLLIANLIAWFFVFNERDFLKVSFFDIGQGDSIFIETENGFQILIDAGPDNSVLYELEKTMGIFDKTIDLVILTHPDKDHYGGLTGVFELYDVDKFIWTGQENESDDFQRFKGLIGDYVQVYAGDKILIDDIVLSILNPVYQNEASSFNDNSVVCMLEHEDSSFLLTGDITSKKEKEILNNFNIEADILKIAHHGSKHSTCEEFIESVNPEIAVISVGENSYGHPGKEVLDILFKNNIKTLRTDRDGTIVFYSKQGNILFKRGLD